MRIERSAFTSDILIISRWELFCLLFRRRVTLKWAALEIHVGRE
jgi:hypothetical protein